MFRVELAILKCSKLFNKEIALIFFVVFNV
jgi:hypothetical protein